MCAERVERPPNPKTLLREMSAFQKKCVEYELAFSKFLQNQARAEESGDEVAGARLQKMQTSKRFFDESFTALNRLYTYFHLNPYTSEMARTNAQFQELKKKLNEYMKLNPLSQRP